MLISAENISKSYNSSFKELEVLKNCSITINEGDYVSILGSSGAGKSTFLNIIASLDKPDSGTIKYHFDNGIDIFQLNDKELSKIRNKEIGFIFQFHHLLPEFTALENVLIPAIISSSKTKRAKEKAKELLNIVGLGDRFSHTPSQLSGGEQQRVAIARSLINEPKIIFADEPTGNLDKKNSEKILELISDLQSSMNLTFINATHSDLVAEKSKIIYKIENGDLIKIK